MISKAFHTFSRFNRWSHIVWAFIWIYNNQIPVYYFKRLYHLHYWSELIFDHSCTPPGCSIWLPYYLNTYLKCKIFRIAIPLNEHDRKDRYRTVWGGMDGDNILAHKKVSRVESGINQIVISVTWGARKCGPLPPLR